MSDKEVKKRGGGRPKWMPPDLDKVEALAARGLTEEQIAHSLGVCYDTLNERKKELSEFAEAIKRGKNKGIAAVANKLYDNAQVGNVSAQIFYLKCRAGWKEVNVTEHQGEVDIGDARSKLLEILLKQAKSGRDSDGDK